MKDEIRNLNLRRILPTERMAQRRREMNQSVDGLTRKENPSWYAGTFQPLERKQRIAQAGTGLCILLAIAMQIALGALAAKSFDSTGDMHVALTQTNQQLTQMENH